MADPVSSLAPGGAPILPTIAVAPPATLIELAQQPPASLLLAATLAAIVVGRAGNGALLLRTDYGTLALKTALALAPGSRIDLKLLPGPPAMVMLLHVEEPPPAPQAAPSALPTPQASPPPQTGAAAVKGAITAAPGTAAAPAQLDLGTEIEATVTSPAAGGEGEALPAGTRLLLRIAVAPAAPDPSPLPSPGPVPPRLVATVAAPAPDAAARTVLETPIGTLTLDKRLALPPGASLTIARIATLAPPPQAAPALGTVVEATVLAPAGDEASPPLPAGTRLVLRLLPMPAAPASGALPAIAGTVAATVGNETIVETPLGSLALERRLTLPPGTLVSLERLAATLPDQPADGPLAQRAGWPALQDALGALDRIAPDLALRLRSMLAPSSAPQLAGTLLFLMSALGNASWPGAKVLGALDSAGRRDLRLRLDGDTAELRQLTDPPSGDWRVFVLPLLDEGAVRPVRLYLRRRAPGNDAEAGTRFVLDVEMSRLGALQLDGLVRSKRFDLVLRSHRAIPAELREGIVAVFRNSIAAAGLAGDIIFTTASRFAVAPLEALRAHVGVEA